MRRTIKLSTIGKVVVTLRTGEERNKIKLKLKPNK